MTPARGFADAGLWVDDKPLRVGLDEATWTGLVTDQRLRATLAALAGHPGAERVLDWLDTPAGGLDSEGERGLLPILSGFAPAPQSQVSAPATRARGLGLGAGEVRARLRRRGVPQPQSRDPAGLAARIAEIYNRRAGQLGIAPLHCTGL